MYKDFDSWNTLKKSLEPRDLVFCNEREIWWCSIGVNIGSETTGKNSLFERPVLVLKVYNKQSILVAPLTTKKKSNTFHKEIFYNNSSGYLILSHAKTISSKRLQRKLSRIDVIQFIDVKKSLYQIMRSNRNEPPEYESAPELTGASEPEGLMNISYHSDLISQYENVEI